MARCKPTPQERFWAKVDRLSDEECWNWLASLNGSGYGHFRVGGPRLVMAHRYAYELLVGPIAEELTLDHLCRNRLCCNPSHLDPVTMRENTMRSPVAPAAIHVRQTHCIYGHPLSGDNLYETRGANGNVYRACKACQRRRGFEYRQRLKLRLTSANNAPRV